MLIPHIAPQRDLLSDDDAHTPAASPPLQDRSAEIGNAKNQLQSTTRSLDAAKQERDALEQTLASQAAQLSTIQTQLSLAKASYETETNLLSALKERRAGQVADIDKTRHELISAESSLSALRAEKAEIEGAFLRDKEEARDLHKRMVEAGQQAEALKTDVEKLKKEAKQQKGLLAIARKQLSTKEAERAKVEKEHEESVAEVAAIAEEKQTVDADIERLDATPLPVPIPKAASPSPSASLMLAAAQPLPTTPEISSPVSTKSNNPFERLAMTSSPPLQSPSPFLGLANTIVSSPISVTEAAPPQEAQQAPAQAAVEVAKEESSAFDDFTSSFTNQDTELSYLGDDPEASHTQEVTDAPGTATSINEFFSTPPTSAFSDASPPLNALERFPSLHDVTATVLPTEKVPSPAPAANGTAAPANPQTDLTTQLKELDVEESDSEDETDSDDEPLYKKSAIANGKARAVDPVPVAEEAPAPVPVASAPAPAPVAAPASIVAASSFEDVFGSSEPPALEAKAAPNGYTTPFDQPASPFKQPAATSIVKPVQDSVPVAGVDEFDAAMGKLGNSTSATPVNFSFETSFDDTFDFSSNSQPQQPVVPRAAPPTGITPKNDFDSLFGTSAPASFAPPPAIPSFTAPVADGTNKVTSSFDEAFGGFDTISAPKLDAKVEKPTSPAFTAEVMPGSFPSSPTQSFTAAAAKPRLSDIRAASPSPRAKSPPPRTTSPAPRPSSSSNKEAHDKPKETATRHSKLSVSHDFVAHS